MAILRYRDDDGRDRELSVGPGAPEVLVGRNPECALRTRNNTVSRLHAKVWWADGVFRVRDLDSANGTWCNRQRIKELHLVDQVNLVFGAFPVSFAPEPGDRKGAVVAQAEAEESTRAVSSCGTAAYDLTSLATGAAGVAPQEGATRIDVAAGAEPPAFADLDLETASSERPPPVRGTVSYVAVSAPRPAPAPAPTPKSQPQPKAPPRPAPASVPKPVPAPVAPQVPVVPQDSMDALRRALAEIEALKLANVAHVRRFARLGSGTGGAAVPAVLGPAPDDARLALDRINNRVSDLRTAVDVLGGLLPEVLDRVPADDAVDQVRVALQELTQGIREVKSLTVAARNRLT